MSRVGHLAHRFFSSLGARDVDVADLTWVQIVLTPEEFGVWDGLGRADRAESVTVARTVARGLRPDVDDAILAAALLHDVGKTDAGLGTFGRAGATVVAGVVSHGRARHFTGRIGRYVRHDELGERKLTAAGARPEARAWAGAHHRPELWPGTGIPLDVCAVLAAADGE
jgi:hypothetical protein